MSEDTATAVIYFQSKVIFESIRIEEVWYCVEECHIDLPMWGLFTHC